MTQPKIHTLTLFQDKYIFGILHKFTMTTYFYTS